MSPQVSSGATLVGCRVEMLPGLVLTGHQVAQLRGALAAVAAASPRVGHTEADHYDALLSLRVIVETQLGKARTSPRTSGGGGSA